MPKLTPSGIEPGQRRLNGPQTTGRDYRNLSDVRYAGMISENNVRIPMRDGTILLADVRRPEAAGDFPALIAAAPYPRQMQDLNAPAGVIESGPADFWVPRGYVQVIVNLRGTNDSGGTWTAFDAQERDDLHDIVEWVAKQPWCDGNVGMTGISYYAMAQMEAAVTNPPHLKAIFPFDVSIEFYDASNHNGLFSAGFITPWIGTLGVLTTRKDGLLRKGLSSLLRKILGIPQIHRRFENVGGENVTNVLRTIARIKHPEHPWNDLWLDMAIQHPTRDAWWEERDLRPLLKNIDVPVYLGAELSNVPLHLGGSLESWHLLKDKENVRMSLLGEHALPWPWESMHIEALAWFDQWLKGRDTGILDGPRVRYWLPGAEEWRTSESWPPPGTQTELALNADGTLAGAEVTGSREYLVHGDSLVRSGGDAPLNLPPGLHWNSGPLRTDFDMVGEIELQLDASITAFDTAWIVALQDIAPNGDVTVITHGWLRAALRAVDEAASRKGRPVLPLTTPEAVIPGEVVQYRIPVLPNAHRFRAGHSVRLSLTSDDRIDVQPVLQSFTHLPVGNSSVNTVHSSSRLILPILDGSPQPEL